MDINTSYRTITREQFLFHEMRIVARLIKEGKQMNRSFRKLQIIICFNIQPKE